MSYSTLGNLPAHLFDTIIQANIADPYVTYYHAITTGVAINHVVQAGKGNAIRLVLSDLNNINTAAPALFFRFGANGDTISGLPADGSPVARGCRILLANRPIWVRIPSQAHFKSPNLHFKEIQTGAGSLFVEYHFIDIP